MLSEFLRFSKVTLALLCSLVVLYVTSSMFICDFTYSIIVNALILFQIVILVNFELWLIHNSTPNHQRLLEELKRKDENDT